MPTGARWRVGRARCKQSVVVTCRLPPVAAGGGRWAPVPVAAGGVASAKALSPLTGRGRRRGVREQLVLGRPHRAGVEGVGGTVAVVSCPLVG